MAFKLTIVDKSLGLNINVRYENTLTEKPETTYKAQNGVQVFNKSLFNGQLPAEGTVTKAYVDEQGNVYPSSEITFWDGDEQIAMVSQTKVLEVSGYFPAGTQDEFNVDKQYTLMPDDNGHKKDLDKQRAVQANTFQLRKLFDHLVKTNTVARSEEFNTSSRGFFSAVGFIKPVSKGDQWGLEITQVRTRKRQHMFAEVPVEPTQATVTAPVIKTRRLI